MTLSTPFWCSKAKVANKQLLNDRPFFTYDYSIERLECGEFKAHRTWYAASTDSIATETLVWSLKKGLMQVWTTHPHLKEQAYLNVIGDHGESQLTSHKTHHQLRAKSLSFKNSPCTLLSIPFEILKHWEMLINTHNIIELDYVVMKVQTHTKVILQRKKHHKYQVFSVTPKNWFWRVMFGSTDFYFEPDSKQLVQINGLLEPRDRNLKGKYIEYLGHSTFLTPLDLSLIKGG